VSTGGVGLYTPDPKGEPQVFYLGEVAPPSSFYMPEEQVRGTGAVGSCLVAGVLEQEVWQHCPVPQCTTVTGCCRASCCAAQQPTIIGKAFLAVLLNNAHM